MGEAVIPTKPSSDEAAKKTFADAVVDALSNIDGRLGALEGSGNQLANGSFEVLDGDGDPDGWVFTGDGAYSVDKASDASPSIAHGEKALKLAVTGAEKTEQATTADYAPTATGDRVEIGFLHKVDDAALDVKAEVLWFDEDKAGLSTSTVYTSTGSNPTSYAKRFTLAAKAPTGARFYKLRLSITSDAGATGTKNAWFDGVYARTPHGTPIGAAGTTLTPGGSPGYYVDVASAIGNGEMPKAALIKLVGAAVPESGGGTVTVEQYLPDGTTSSKVFEETVSGAREVYYLTVNLDCQGRFRGYIGTNVTMTLTLHNYWV